MKPLPALPGAGAPPAPGGGSPGARSLPPGSWNGRVDTGPRVASAVYTRPYERPAGAPTVRPLRVLPFDPAISRFEAGGAVIAPVPYEPLDPGPAGALLRVDDVDADGVRCAAPLDLDAPAALLAQGRMPSAADLQSHQQVAYAVCSLVYDRFRRALGRHVGWSFAGAARGADAGRLLVRPHGLRAPNAWYDPVAGELCFGSFPAEAGDLCTDGRTRR